MALVIHDKALFEDIKNGLVSVDELASYFTRTYPVTQLAKELAEIMLSEGRVGIKPVVLTLPQFQSFFRLQGYRWVDGELKPENRGAKRKEV